MEEGRSYANFKWILLLAALLLAAAPAEAQTLKDSIYDPGVLKPIDSTLKVKTGQAAPDFTLPAVTGGKVGLKDFRGKKNVVISFVPAAFTPVCSDQWPGYNMARGLFEANDAVLLGITVDNIPTLYAWTRQMGPELWFPVLSDFWPHGAVAKEVRRAAHRRDLRAGALLHRQARRAAGHHRERHQPPPRPRADRAGDGEDEQEVSAKGFEGSGGQGVGVLGVWVFGYLAGHDARRHVIGQ